MPPRKKRQALAHTAAGHAITTVPAERHTGTEKHTKAHMFSSFWFGVAEMDSFPGTLRMLSVLPTEITNLNGVLTARDGKHTYKTKMKHGMFDFGIIKAGYYKISGEGRYEGKKVRYYGEKSVVPAFDEITACVSGGHGFRTF